MMELPRQLNSGEMPDYTWFNKLLEAVRSNQVLESHTVRPERVGSGTILHAEPAVGGAVPSAFPGVVYVNFNRFYDPEIVTDVADQVGNAIADNSTDSAKEYIKVLMTGTVGTDAANISVTYEDAPALASPTPEVSWFKVSDWDVPISIIPPSGADANGQVWMRTAAGVYEWVEVETGVLPSGATAGQVYCARIDDASSLEADGVWKDYASLPDGTKGALLQNEGGEASDPNKNWRALSGATKDDLLCMGSDGLWRFLDFSATYPAVVIYDPGSDPAFKVIAPDSATPGAFIWQPGNARLEFIEADAMFKYLGRMADDTLAFNYIQVD